MTANDIILIAILALGALWINWGTIRRDLFQNQADQQAEPRGRPRAKPTEAPKRDRKSVEHIS